MVNKTFLTSVCKCNSEVMQTATDTAFCITQICIWQTADQMLTGLTKPPTKPRMKYWLVDSQNYGFCSYFLWKHHVKWSICLWCSISNNAVKSIKKQRRQKTSTSGNGSKGSSWIKFTRQQIPNHLFILTLLMLQASFYILNRICK